MRRKKNRKKMDTRQLGLNLLDRLLVRTDETVPSTNLGLETCPYIGPSSTPFLQDE